MTTYSPLVTDLLEAVYADNDTTGLKIRDLGKYVRSIPFVKAAIGEELDKELYENKFYVSLGVTHSLRYFWRIRVINVLIKHKVLSQ